MKKKNQDEKEEEEEKKWWRKNSESWKRIGQIYRQTDAYEEKTHSLWHTYILCSRNENEISYKKIIINSWPVDFFMRKNRETFESKWQSKLINMNNK